MIGSDVSEPAHCTEWSRALCSRYALLGQRELCLGIDDYAWLPVLYGRHAVLRPELYSCQQDRNILVLHAGYDCGDGQCRLNHNNYVKCSGYCVLYVGGTGGFLHTAVLSGVLVGNRDWHAFRCRSCDMALGRVCRLPILTVQPSRH